MSSYRPFTIPLVLISLPLLTLACSGGGTPPGTPQVPCADITLRVSPRSTEQTYSFSSQALPSLAVDLSAVAGTDMTRITIRDCAASAAGASRDFPGTDSFVVDPAWYAASVPAGCYRVGVAALQKGMTMALSTAKVQRGDFALNGQVVPPSGTPPSGQVHVIAQVERELFQRAADPQGKFLFAGLPAGRVLRVRAQTGAGAAGFLRGDIAPLLTLDAEHPSASVSVPLSAVPFAVDAYEPDDTLQQAAARKPIVIGATEEHTLSDKGDIDLVPIQTAAGASYLIILTPGGPSPGDLSVQVIDQQGNFLAHANDRPGDFVPRPSLGFSSPTGALLYVRVSRGDGESHDVPYKVKVALVAAR